MPAETDKANETSTGARFDPVAAFRFYVDIGQDGVAFAECSGLEVEREIYEYQEGGVNDYVHRLPGRTKISDVTLKRGITSSESSKKLYEWYMQVLHGKTDRRNVSIVLYDPVGSELMRWTLVAAYPVKWVGPIFKGDAGEVAVETLQLAHAGIQISY